jgi:hypothetical protein
MMVRSKTNSFLGLLAGKILSIFGKSRIEPAPEDFKQMEFKTSTQRMGVSFTDKIRRTFRFRWVKRH